MRTISVFGILIALAGTHQLTFAGECSNAPFGRCGGEGWDGSECCTEGYECKVQNPYYSQCVPIDQSSSTCAQAYGQCGGKAYSGETCCVSGFECVKANTWYSQCLPKYRWGSSAPEQSDSDHGNEVVTTTEDVKPTTTAEQPKPTTTTVESKTEPTTTKEPAKPTTTTTTVEEKPTTTAKPTTTTEPPKTTKTTTVATTTTKSSGSSSTYAPISGGASGSGSTTRYWDCCKASCGWDGKADVTSPVGSCAANGVTLVDSNTQSGCVGGSAYMCNDNQPWAVSDDLAYGFAAASIAGKDEAGWCCGCYELTFSSGPVSGKKMVVQVTNTGGDLGSNHFDLQIPGGGVGIFNGCETQWNSPTDGWGQRYGGLSSANECSKLPSQIRDGCEWRFDWFKNADNPSVTFKEVTCPAELVKRTGCSRK
ncbi:RlpA-like double-psi beta-barrel-protein domain-containing protein-containing protein [Fennellomyces sp. T-0311]|nr:RlpA-like double-psi beta-barrel-protein domain-containing protein-containing protein [Fennellomyces sp. T-0311]